MSFLYTQELYRQIFRNGVTAEMSKTFSACQTFGLTNLENLPDRMKTCQTEYKLYKLFHVLINFCKQRL